MDAEPSKIWRLALIVSLLLFAAVAYYRFEPVRALVDAKCPWIKEQLASRGIVFEGDPQTSLAATPAKNITATGLAVENPSMASKPGSTAAATPTPRSVTSQEPPAEKLSQSAERPLDISQIAADHSLWPKTVQIKKITIFPAVVQGKEVGKITLPAGAEVKLVSISGGKLGLIYTPDGTMSSAGGAMVPPEDTDLLERVRVAQAPH